MWGLAFLHFLYNGSIRKKHEFAGGGTKELFTVCKFRKSTISLRPQKDKLEYGGGGRGHIWVCVEIRYFKFIAICRINFDDCNFKQVWPVQVPVEESSQYEQALSSAEVAEMVERMEVNKNLIHITELMKVTANGLSLNWEKLLTTCLQAWTKTIV